MPGLDYVLLGGFLPGGFYLVQGDRGSGKTTVALQYVLGRLAAGERCPSGIPNLELMLHGGLTTHLHELFGYLNHEGILTLIVVARHGMIVGTGTPSDVDVSYLADSVLLYRYFEAGGEIHQAISVFEKRTGPHERTLRQLRISADGLTLRAFRGVMTGVPQYDGNAGPPVERRVPSRGDRIVGLADPNDARVLVWMPTARDGERISVSLAEEGLDCTLCGDLETLCREMGAGAGAVLLTEEALGDDRAGRLGRTLDTQPAWSDLPIVLLACEKASTRPSSYREALNVSLVERPVRVRSLLSVIRAALRARRHQYDVRDHLFAREQQTTALCEQEERLQFALSAGRLGSWDLDLVTNEMICSPLCKENYGRSPGDPFSYRDLVEAIHPDDRERMAAAVARAIAEGSDYDVEYRNVWPDGTTHWVLVRGRATYAPDGRPLWMRWVSLDMTDRRRAEEGLRDSDRKKDDFLALLAHELRNPLAPIRNGLQVLRRTSDGNVRRTAEEMMDRQLGHMVRLIDDLLDVSCIDRNKMELRMARISLADAIGSAIETARPVIEAAGHDFELTLPDEPVWLDADLTRLAQVFANLLTNSARYTDRGGWIHLGARHEGDSVVITVHDTGIGIAADDLGTIFDMFSQVTRTVERSTGGLGIGLALVRGLVEMHGGTVQASSGGLGRGSAFTVRLPAVPSRPGSGRGSVAQTRTDNHPSRAGHRILVVDDNRDSAESLAEILRLDGNEVAVAHDGLEGVAQAAAFLPELILMDLGMPRLDGLEATRQIRAQPWGRDMAIVALTGWGQDSDRLRSREAGCDAHLVKPASFEDIDRLVNELVGGGAS